jgi:hypothetical protein
MAYRIISAPTRRTVNRSLADSFCYRTANAMYSTGTNTRRNMQDARRRSTFPIRTLREPGSDAGAAGRPEITDRPAREVRVRRLTEDGMPVPCIYSLRDGRREPVP